MHLSPKEKQSLVARYHAGKSVAEISADTGVARSTFYIWSKPYTITKIDSGYKDRIFFRDNFMWKPPIGFGLVM